MVKKVQTIIEYKRALIYCRVSSERQVNEGHGLDSQEQRCIRRASDMGLEVAKVFRDEGVSGGLFDRPAMQQLIKYLDARLHENFIIIFDDLSRFARDVQVHIQLKSELISRGAKLECLNLKLDDTDESELVEIISAAAAQYQRKTNKRQVIQKMKARLEVGFWCFCPPPGLKFDKDAAKGQILRPNAPQSVIFKAAIEKYRDFELNTLEEVQQFIISQYRLNGLSKSISISGVKRLLTNVLYAGCIEYEPWGIPLMKNAHEGFISYETFLAVQDRLNNVSKPRIRKDQNMDFPLRNYVLCQSCKFPLTAAWFKGRKEIYGYYLCKQKGCHLQNKTVKADIVEADFVKLLKRVTPSPEVLKLAEKVLIDLWESQRKNEGQVKAGVSAQLNKFEIQNKTLVERIAKASSDGLVSEYEKIIAQNVAEIKNLQKELDKTKYSQDGFQTAVGAVFEYLSKPLQQWQTRGYAGKRLLLGMYFEQKIAYNRDFGFQTAQIPFVLATISQNHESKNHLVEMPGVKPGSKT